MPEFSHIVRESVSYRSCSTFEKACAALKKSSQAPEMIRYRDEPPQMKSAAVGKVGYLRLEFDYDDKLERTILSDLDRRAPLLAQKALYWDESQPDMACVIMISTTGSVIQGDRLALEVRAGRDAHALVTTQSATKVHSMTHNYAFQMQNFYLEENSYLEYMPDTLILHRSARYMQDTHVVLPESASFVYGEILLPGRRWHHSEELFGFDVYSSGFSVIRPGDRIPVVEERLVIFPETTQVFNAGIMGGFMICGSLFALLPNEILQELKKDMEAGVTAELAWGAVMLPANAGLAFRILGHSTESVKAKMREVHSLIRQKVLGKPLPAEFLWR